VVEMTNTVETHLHNHEVLDKDLINIIISTFLVELSLTIEPYLHNHEVSGQIFCNIFM